LGGYWNCFRYLSSGGMGTILVTVSSGSIFAPASE
jgi:hypothetical protein